MRLTLRGYKPADENFVRSAWQESLRDLRKHPGSAHHNTGKPRKRTGAKQRRGNAPWDSIPAYIYYNGMGQLIDRLLQNSTVVLAVDEEDPDFIAGFLVYQSPRPELFMCHYIYVRKPLRDRGIANHLLSSSYPFFKEQPFFYTFHTKTLEYRCTDRSKAKDPANIDGRTIAQRWVAVNDPFAAYLRPEDWNLDALATYVREFKRIDFIDGSPACPGGRPNA